jgi:hypothetical protein
VLLDALGEAGRLGWSRISVDSVSLRATKGGTIQAQTHRPGKAGSKLHVAAEATGIPLAVVLAAANPHDPTLFAPC